MQSNETRSPLPPWLDLAGIAVFVALSVVGAFIGALRAPFFFNSAPLAALWVITACVVAIHLVARKNPFRRPGLSAILLGTLLVLGGSMWGSAAGHRVRARLFGRAKARKGHILVPRGQTSRAVMGIGFMDELGRLPFDVAAKACKARADETHVTITRSGRPVAEGKVRVNHPLHYGGYHFYFQRTSMDPQRYAILMVVSDSGLWLVYAGFALLLAGVVGKLWLRRALAQFRKGKRE